MEGGLKGRAGGWIRPFCKIDRGVAGSHSAHRSAVLGRVIETLAGRTRVLAVFARDHLQNQPTVFSAAGKRPYLVERPRQCHGPVPAHQSVGWAQGGDAAIGRWSHYGT